LFQIIQLLRLRRRAVTASRIAEQLSVSERTVYRDIRDLIATGTPIEGAAGVGYTLRREYDLPPLMFDAEEVQALVVGARIAAAFGDESMARAATAALSKVEAVLPERLRPGTLGTPLFAPRTWTSQAASEGLVSLRAALSAKQKLRLRYQTEDGRKTDRVVRPLAAFFWGKSWTLTAWCELRDDFRSFRLDRILELSPTGETFADEAGRTLRDFLRTIGGDAERLLDE
jgi:predicted DNA-binding transcriptional regulator YafY